MNYVFEYFKFKKCNYINDVLCHFDFASHKILIDERKECITA